MADRPFSVCATRQGAANTFQLLGDGQTKREREREREKKEDKKRKTPETAAPTYRGEIDSNLKNYWRLKPMYTRPSTHMYARMKTHTHTHTNNSHKHTSEDTTNQGTEKSMAMALAGDLSKWRFSDFSVKLQRVAQGLCNTSSPYLSGIPCVCLSNSVLWPWEGGREREREGGMEGRRGGSMFAGVL